MDFAVGDYVLTASHADRSKVRPSWEGPARVIAVEPSGLVFLVQSLITSETKRYHARFLKRYSDASLTITPQLKEYIAFNSVGSVIHAIVGHRRLPGGPWELQVQWAPDEDVEEPAAVETTWEPLIQIFKDAPIAVRRYVRLLSDTVERSRLQTVLSTLSRSK